MADAGAGCSAGRTLTAGLRRGLSILALALLCAARAAGLAVDYTVQPVPPHRGASAFTRVEMRIRGAASLPSLRVQMPAWSPGDYRLVHHARYVRALAAADAEGRRLIVRRADADTWVVASDRRPDILVTYRLRNAAPGRFTQDVIVTSRFAYYEGAPTYLYVAGHTGEPVTLTVRPPPGWLKIVTPLGVAPAHGPARFEARSYDTLADSPLLVGACETRDFEAAGRPHVLACFRDAKDAGLDGVVGQARRVIDWMAALMGGLPYDRYVFFIDRGGAGGALEHACSCRIAWPVDQPQSSLMLMLAHEYFHLWNVKGIRPASFVPLDYIHPPRTGALWFLEGVTDYYARLSQEATGIESEDSFLRGLAGQVEALQGSDARRRVTAEESSLRVWEAGNSDGYGISYYTKGLLIGLCLDLAIAHDTGGRATLDDVMRDLLARYGAPRPGFPEDALREAFVRVGGADLGSLYDRCCRSTDELPLAESLAYAGMRLDTSGGVVQIVPDAQASPGALAIRSAWLRRRGTGVTPTGAGVGWRGKAGRRVRAEAAPHPAGQSIRRSGVCSECPVANALPLQPRTAALGAVPGRYLRSLAAYFSRNFATFGAMISRQ